MVILNIFCRRDCTDVEDLTAAEMEGREQAMHALSALKNVVPGFGKAKLRNFGMTIGTRDSRKIVGRFALHVQWFFVSLASLKVSL